MERLVGKSAPAFKMKAVKGDGSEFIEVKLEDYRDNWLVMFFYPLDFAFVCPTEITAFSDKYEEFIEEGAEVLIVSCDSEHSHKTWIEGSLGKIKFPMASDMTKTVSREYGVLIEEEGIALRGLFIISPQAEVEYSAIHKINVGRNIDEIIRVLKAIKTGGLCSR